MRSRVPCRSSMRSECLLGIPVNNRHYDGLTLGCQVERIGGPILAALLDGDLEELAVLRAQADTVSVAGWIFLRISPMTRYIPARRRRSAGLATRRERCPLSNASVSF